MKLAFIGLKGHVGTVLTGVKLLGDVEVVAVAEENPVLMPSRSRRSIVTRLLMWCVL